MRIHKRSFGRLRLCFIVQVKRYQFIPEEAVKPSLFNENTFFYYLTAHLFRFSLFNMCSERRTLKGKRKVLELRLETYFMQIMIKKCFYGFHASDFIHPKAAKSTVFRWGESLLKKGFVIKKGIFHHWFCSTSFETYSG